MRTILASCLAALMLAGCTAGYGSNGPKADPNGSKSYPPTPDSNTTGPPTGSDAPTPSSSSASSTYSTSFAAHDQDDSASDANFPGLGVNGHLSGSGPQVHVEVTANDFGERTYRVPDGQCAQPFTEMMTAPDGSGVQIRAPDTGCTGFGLRDFKPGDYESKGLDWNGTVWDAVQGRFVTATAGTYTWTLTAHLYPSDATARSQGTDMSLEFQVYIR